MRHAFLVIGAYAKAALGEAVETTSGAGTNHTGPVRLPPPNSSVVPEVLKGFLSLILTSFSPLSPFQHDWDLATLIGVSCPASSCERYWGLNPLIARFITQHSRELLGSVDLGVLSLLWKDHRCSLETCALEILFVTNCGLLLQYLFLLWTGRCTTSGSPLWVSFSTQFGSWTPFCCFGQLTGPC